MLAILVATRCWRLSATRRSTSSGLGITLSHLLILLGRWLTLGTWASLTTVRLATTFIKGVGRLRRRIDVGQPAGPVLTSRPTLRRVLRTIRTVGRCLLSRTSPARRPNGPCGLVRLRMNIGGLRGGWWRSTIAGARAQKLKASLDVRVAGIKFRGSLVGVQCIRDLVVTRFILGQGQNVKSNQARRNLPECQDRTKPPKCTGSGE